MAILGMEGFDHYSDVSNTELAATENYTVSGTTQVNCSSTGTRFAAGKLLKIDDDSASLNVSTGSSITDTIVISFAYKNAGDLNPNGQMCSIMNGTTVQCHLGTWLSADGRIYARLSTTGTILGSSTNTLSANTWYWIEMKVKVADGTAGTFHVNVDGVEWIGLTGIDTSSAGGSTVTGFKLTSINARTSYFDDLVWQDDTTTPDFLGDSRIETFTPTGDASVTWDNSTASGTNASHIDEIPPVDTDYVYTATVEEDLYDFNTIADDDDVHAISLKYRAQKTDTGTRSIQSRTSELVTGTDVQGGAEKALSTDWVQYSDVFETTDDGTPDAGSAWTQALIGTATFGVKVTV